MRDFQLFQVGGLSGPEISLLVTFCLPVFHGSQNTKSVQEVSKQKIWRPLRKPIFIWSRQSDSNRRPADYKSAALPAELCRRNERLNVKTVPTLKRKCQKAIVTLQFWRPSDSVARLFTSAVRCSRFPGGGCNVRCAVQQWRSGDLTLTSTRGRTDH